MPGKITKIDATESQTGAQNEQLPTVIKPEPAPAEEAQPQE